MKCSVCSQEMQIKRNDISHNLKKGSKYKKYKRTIYWCEKDDVWISVEIPAYEK